MLEQVERKGKKRIALVAPTAADVRDVMVEGESGILACAHPDRRPIYQPSKRRIVWPQYDAIATTYTADKPRQLRGPQHDAAWCDELAAWRYANEAWDMLQFGLRLGDDPRACITTTPRPTPIVKALASDPDTVRTSGSTHENAPNVARTFIQQILRKYEGTRLGRQEIYAEILSDNPGALWKRTQLDADRVSELPAMWRIVVSIDPAVTSNASSAETGIIVAGVATVRGLQHGYVLEDLSGTYTPGEWARVAITALRKWNADRIIGEVNNGGDLVEANLRGVDKNIPYKSVRASRGKQTRAEPVAALDEQHRIHHVGFFGPLEDQLCDWDPTIAGPSPDRLDARVWAFTELILDGEGPSHIEAPPPDDDARWDSPRGY